MKRLWTWLVPDGSTKLHPRAFFVLALLAFALYAPGQIGLPVMDRDEARYGQATRQMLASGDFIDIKFADQDRYLQPIGIYWLQAAAALPFGGEHAGIWAFRLPSLLSAILTVLLTAWFGARLYGPNVGLAAGLILAPSLLLAGEVHFAKIDSTLLLVTLIAQVALYLTVARPTEEKQRFIGWPLVFWLAMGAGGLLKGPIILLIVGLTVVAYGIWQKEWRYLLRLNPILGILIVAAIIAPWLIAINIETKGAFLQHALGHSLGYKIAHGEQSHGQPPGYHTILFMLTFFPGVVLAGLAGVYAWKNRRERIVRFLLCWIVPTWIMFELVGTKLPHYTLPVFPAVALLASLGLKDAEALRADAGRIAHWVAGLLFLIAAVAVTVLPVGASLALDGGRHFVLPTVCWFLCLCIMIAGAFLWFRPSPEKLLPLAAAAALAYFCMFQLLIPGFDRLWVSDRIARVAKTLEGCERITAATAGFTEPSIIFHFGAATILGNGKSAADHLATHPACGIAVVEKSEKPAFQAELEAEGIKVQRFGSAEGVNYVNGDVIELELFGADTSALELPGTVHDEPEID